MTVNRAIAGTWIAPLHFITLAMTVNKAIAFSLNFTFGRLVSKILQLKNT
ncbi:hypothetical protein H6G04_10715 [Calothrix membranacea FACHB-236]|nr:hypothetical protein [Calothrix membranacea FACHB-236]